MLHVEATIWNKDRDPRLAFTMQIDLDNPFSDLRSPCDDDPARRMLVRVAVVVVPTIEFRSSSAGLTANGLERCRHGTNRSPLLAVHYVE